MIEKDFILRDDLPFMPDFKKRGDRHIFDRVFVKHGFGTQDDHIGRELKDPVPFCGFFDIIASNFELADAFVLKHNLIPRAVPSGKPQADVVFQIILSQFSSLN